MDDESNSNKRLQLRIARGTALIALGSALMSRLPQLLSGQQEPLWYQSPFMIVGMIIVFLGLLILFVPTWCWKYIWRLLLESPTQIYKNYIWKRYGPIYSLDKLSLQQPLQDHDDTYKAIISLQVKNRDNDSLEIDIQIARFNFQQRLRRKMLLATLEPTTGFPLKYEIAPHKETRYEIPFIGFCNSSNCINLQGDYDWEIHNIGIKLEEIGYKWLSKKGKHRQCQN